MTDRPPAFEIWQQISEIVGKDAFCLKQNHIKVNLFSHSSATLGSVLISASQPWADSELHTQLSYVGVRPHLSNILPLPSRRLDWYQIIAYCLVTEAHGCEQLAQSCYLDSETPGVEPTTSRSQVWRANHYTTKPYVCELAHIGNQSHLMRSLRTATDKAENRRRQLNNERMSYWRSVP